MIIQWNTAGIGVGAAMINLPDNTWFHACVVYSATTTLLTLYLNAVNTSYLYVNHSAGVTAPPVLGGEPDTGAAPTAGSFNSWRYYNRSLSAADVLTIYISDAPTGYSSPLPSSSTAGGGSTGGVGAGAVPLSTFFTAAAASSSSLVRVALIGDSISWGLYNSQPNPSVNGTSYPDHLRQALQTKYGNGGSGFISIGWTPDSGLQGSAAYSSANFPLALSSSSAWTLQNYVGATYDVINCFTLISTTSGAIATFTVRGATIVLWYATQPSGGTFSVTIDGVVVSASINSASITPTSTSVTYGGTYSAGYTTHSVVVTVLSQASGVILQGVDAYNNAGIVLDQYTFIGVTFDQWVNANGAIASAGISQRPASLLILALGVNDGYVAGDTGAETAANILSYITTLTSAFTSAGIPIVYDYLSYGLIGVGGGNYSLIPGDVIPLVSTFVNSALNDTQNNGTIAAANGYLGCPYQLGACGYLWSSEYPGTCPDAIHTSDRGATQIYNDLATALQLPYLPLPLCSPPTPPSSSSSYSSSSSSFSSSSSSSPLPTPSSTSSSSYSSSSGSSSFSAPQVGPWCVGLATPQDTQNCLNTLWTTNPGASFVMSIPNYAFIISLDDGYGNQQPLFVGPNVSWNGMNCSITHTGVSAYLYDPTIGWYESTGPQPGVVGWANSMVGINSNSVFSNTTLISPIPLQAVNINTYTSNVVLSYLTIANFPGLFNNGSTGYNRYAIGMLGGWNHNIEIHHNYIYNIGYSIIMDSYFIHDVYIHDNTITYTCCDGVAMNSPAFGYELGQLTYNPHDYAWTPYMTQNVSVVNNYIGPTGVCQQITGGPFNPVNDQSCGFGWSCAGCWNMTIVGNTFVNVSYNAVHLEANTKFVLVANNVFNGMQPVDPELYWNDFLNAINGGAYALTITGNTFMNLPEAAILLDPGGYRYCVLTTGPGTPNECMPYPIADQFENNVLISGNNFSSYGLTGGSQFYAIHFGGSSYVYEWLNSTITNNTYSPIWSQFSGGNRIIWTQCTPNYGLTIYETNVYYQTSPGVFSYQTLTTMQGTQTSGFNCVPTDITGYSSSQVGWWMVASIPNPLQYQPWQNYNPTQWDITNFPVSVWSDYTHGINLVATSTDPIFMPGSMGQPGVQFSSSTPLHGTGLWPTGGTSYTILLIIVLYSSSNQVILSSATSSLSIINGYIVLSHGGVAASGSNPAVPILDQAVYIGVVWQSGGAVTYYIDGTQCGTATLSTTNTDSSLTMGGGGSANFMIHDLMLYNTFLDATGIQSQMYYQIAILYCSAFGYITQGSCPNSTAYIASLLGGESCPIWIPSSSSSSTGPALIGVPQGLLLDFPLQGNYLDGVSGTATATPTPSGCSSFTAVSPVSNAYSETCGASLSASVPGSSYNSWSVSAIFNLATLPVVYDYQPEEIFGPDTEIFFSCGEWDSQTVDCINLVYMPFYPLFIAQINENGDTAGLGATPGKFEVISAGSWFHLGVTFSSATSALTLYVNGTNRGSVVTEHNNAFSSTFTAGPGFQSGSVINWRIYTTALTDYQMATIFQQDYPWGQQGTGTGVIGGASGPPG